MKHLVPEPRDVTLSIRGLGRLPRGNGRVPGVGEPNTNSCCPPPQASEGPCLRGPRSHGAPVPPRGHGCSLTGRQQRSGKSGGRGHRLGFRQERRQTVATRTQGMGQWLCQRPPRPSSIRRDQNSEPGGFPLASPILSPGVGVSSRTGENQVTLMSQNIPFLPSATVSVPAILASVFHLGLWVAPTLVQGLRLCGGEGR